MIVDTSALVAVIALEPEAMAFATAMENAEMLRISAGTFVEAGVVLNRRGDPALDGRFDALMEEAGFIIEPVTVEQARIARQAYRDYGKGSGHPAQLNFGDCFSYALAREKREPILFKGDDFRHTDLRPAI
ncbi:MAG TPA: type II toxin-antitoxin system VapC family toxin [Terracidiphilus sp.]|nr:type II toxin-antitoxin system VapC family toxin [Terracidiphilus sp.]